MNPVAAGFFLIVAIALFVVPRRWAPVPLLIGCCYMTMGQGIELGSISLPIYRMLLLVGIVRIMVKGESIQGPLNSIDKIVIAWAVWVFFASFFHVFEPGSGPNYAAGFIFNVVAVYFLIRIWCSNLEEAVGIVIVVAFLLAPIAAEMIMERITKINQFSIFGGVPYGVDLREGKYRAQGPFRHSILAGTVGATCLPLFIGIWKRNRSAAITGIISALVMVVTCASSGPVMSAMAGVCAVCMWKLRNLTKLARLAAVAVYIAFTIYTGEPGYYIMKRIDISGGSTGWHRARLIESAFNHLGDWWLFGTDYTRDWMDTGVSFSPNHADITNYYLVFGVTGGLVAMLLVIAMLIVAFRWVGVLYRAHFDVLPSDSFMIWCLGAGMFAHATTSISVSYFDQSMVFFWMNLAVIGSVYSCYLIRQESGETEHIDMEQSHSDHDGMGVQVNRSFFDRGIHLQHGTRLFPIFAHQSARYCDGMEGGMGDKITVGDRPHCI